MAFFKLASKSSQLPRRSTTRQAHKTWTLDPTHRDHENIAAQELQQHMSKRFFERLPWINITNGYLACERYRAHSAWLDRSLEHGKLLAP